MKELVLDRQKMPLLELLSEPKIQLKHIYTFLWPFDKSRVIFTNHKQESGETRISPPDYPELISVSTDIWQPRCLYHLKQKIIEEYLQKISCYFYSSASSLDPSTCETFVVVIVTRHARKLHNIIFLVKPRAAWSMDRGRLALQQLSV